MALETATHIDDLVAANPTGLDDRRTVDDHIRMIKDVLVRDLPLDAPASTVGMNVLKGATSEAIRSLLGASNTPFRNRVINGDMTINNRGQATLVVAGAPLVYTLDRFYAYCSGGNINVEQFVGTGSKKRMSITSTNGSNTGVVVGTRLSLFNTNDLVNKNATLSCSLKIGTGTINVNWAVYYANGPESFGTIASPARTAIASGTFAATTTETIFSATMAVPSPAFTGIEIVFSTGALNNSGFPLLIADVQFEKGSISASDIVFENIDAPLQEARCAYYYRKTTGAYGVTVLGSGHQNSTTVSRITLPINKMRSIPVVAFGGNVLVDIAGATSAATLSTQYNSQNTVAFDVTHAAIGAAGGAAMLQLPINVTNYIEIDAEMYA